MSGGLEFALARIYDAFHARWTLTSPRLGWARVWAEHLGSATTEELTIVADYCLAEMDRCPSLPEFRQLIEQLRNGEPLSAPIVSPQERLAFLILTADEFVGVDRSELADACLIAAATLNSKAHESLGLEEEDVARLFVGRAQMFADEVAGWRKEAASGKGYWTFLFGESRIANGKLADDE